MTTYTKHEPGTFSWVELATTDVDAAKSFYGKLFGWTHDDTPAGPDAVYTTAKLGENDVAGLFKIGGEMTGMPPQWITYVAVDDVDSATKKASESGATVLKEPFDVLDIGRMAVIQDPSGASLSLWQAKKHIGLGVKDESGSLCWGELFTTDVDAAKDFYTKAFGWEANPIDMGPGGIYTLFKLPGEDRDLGGMYAMPPYLAGAPSQWIPYFATDDCEASAAKAAELGAKTLVPPTEIPNIGRFAILQDTAGATFALYKNEH